MRKGGGGEGSSSYGDTDRDPNGQVFMSISSQTWGDISDGDTLHFLDVTRNVVSSLYYKN